MLVVEVVARHSIWLMRSWGAGNNYALGPPNKGSTGEKFPSPPSCPRLTYPTPYRNEYLQCMLVVRVAAIHAMWLMRSWGAGNNYALGPQNKGLAGGEIPLPSCPRLIYPTPYFNDFLQCILVFELDGGHVMWLVSSWWAGNNNALGC